MCMAACTEMPDDLSLWDLLLLLDTILCECGQTQPLSGTGCLRMLLLLHLLHRLDRVHSDLRQHLVGAVSRRCSPHSGRVTWRRWLVGSAEKCWWSNKMVPLIWRFLYNALNSCRSLLIPEPDLSERPAVTNGLELRSRNMWPRRSWEQLYTRC